jgi:hypothetical protein
MQKIGGNPMTTDLDDFFAGDPGDQWSVEEGIIWEVLRYSTMHYTPVVQELERLNAVQAERLQQAAAGEAEAEAQAQADVLEELALEYAAEAFDLREKVALLEAQLATVQRVAELQKEQIAIHERIAHRNIRLMAEK